MRIKEHRRPGRKPKYKLYGEPKIEIMKWTQLDIQVLEQKVKQLQEKKLVDSVIEMRKTHSSYISVDAIKRIENI